MKPRKPTKPKGLDGSSAKRRGRSVGTSMQYTPEQTQRYKSQALRYSKAVELAVAGPDFVQTKDGMQLSSDVIKGKGRDVFELSDRLLFKYASDRAPRDYWTVTGSAERPEPVEEALYDFRVFDIRSGDQAYSITINDELVASIPNATVPDVLFTASTLNGGLKIEIQPTAIAGRPDVAISFKRQVPIVAPLRVEVEATVNSAVGTPRSLLSWLILSDFTTPDFPLGFGDADFYTLVTPPFPKSRATFHDYFGGDDVLEIFGVSEVEAIEVDESLTNENTFILIFSELSNQPFDFKTTYRFNVTDDDFTTGFVCDCPDYTKAIGALPRSQFNSERRDREWVGSEAGCDTEQGCKHVIATKLHLDLPIEVPTDIPL